MAKKSGGGTKGAIGGLFTTSNLVKTGAAVTAALYAWAKINAENDTTTWTYKFGQLVGMKAKSK